MGDADKLELLDEISSELCLTFLLIEEGGVVEIIVEDDGDREDILSLPCDLSPSLGYESSAAYTLSFSIDDGKNSGGDDEELLLNLLMAQLLKYFVLRMRCVACI